MILKKPGWRELYSRRILVAKCLHQLEEQYRAAVAVMLHQREHGRLPDPLPPEFEAVTVSGPVLQVAGTSLDWTFPTH